MAISRTNVSSNAFDLGASTTATLSHNHPTASNWLIVIVAIDSYSSISGVTYNGASMTLVQSNSSYYGGIWNVYKLDATSHTGTHNVVVSGLQSYDKVNVASYSFSGAGGVGNTAINNTPATSTNDATVAVTISSNSMIIANGWNGGGSFANTSVQIPDNTEVTVNYTGAMYTCTWGGCSGSLTSGSKTCAVNQSVGYAAIIMVVEVLEGAGSATLATVITNTSVTSITRTTAVSGGNVTADGGATVTARGVCWNTSTNPTTSNSSDVDGSGGTGTFTSDLISLTPYTLYYVRAFATNSVGTAYGSNVTFTTGRRVIII